MKILIAILLAILIGFSSFKLGIEWEQEQSSVPPDVALGIEYMEEGRWNHQYYINNPEELEIAGVEWMGDVAFHKRWVGIYDHVLYLLREWGRYEVEK